MYKLKTYPLHSLNKRDDFEAFLKFKMDCIFSTFSEVTKASSIMNVLYSY